MPDPAPPPAVLLCAGDLNQLWHERGGFIQALQDLGFRVICAGRLGRAADALRAMDCEIAPLAWSEQESPSLPDLGMALGLARRMRRWRPVAVFSYGARANLAAGLAAGMARLPHVASILNLGADFTARGLVAGLERRMQGLIQSAAHTTIFHNPGDLALFRRLGLATGRRVELLPGAGVNLTRFPFAPLDRPVTTFAMLSPLRRDKGVMEYLEAAERLKRERPGLRFLLAGAPEGGEHGLELGEVTGYGAAVEYVGDLRDPRPLMLRAECIVLPSYREGLPSVLMQAAALGRISVVSDVEGCRDAIQPERTGLLCEPRSASSLTESMRRAARLRAPVVAAMSRQARDLATSRFDERLSIDPCLSIALHLAGDRSPLARTGVSEASGSAVQTNAR